LLFLFFQTTFDAKIFLNELKNLFDELTLKYEELNLIDEKEEDIIKILDRLNNNCEINGILPIRPIPKILMNFQFIRQ